MVKETCRQTFTHHSVTILTTTAATLTCYRLRFAFPIAECNVMAAIKNGIESKGAPCFPPPTAIKKPNRVDIAMLTGQTCQESFKIDILSNFIDSLETAWELLIVAEHGMTFVHQENESLVSLSFIVIPKAMILVSTCSCVKQ